MVNFIIYMAIAMAVIGPYMAYKRGRSAFLGLLAGLIFGFWAFIYYLIVGDTTEHRVKKEIEIKQNLGIN